MKILFKKSAFPLCLFTLAFPLWAGEIVLYDGLTPTERQDDPDSPGSWFAIGPQSLATGNTNANNNQIPLISPKTQVIKYMRFLALIAKAQMKA